MIEKFGAVGKLNPNNGQVTVVGFAQGPGQLWHGLARDSSGKIYSANGDNILGFALYEINPSTGQATFVSQTSFIGLRGIAFGPGDVLYGWDHRNGPVVDDLEDLHIIDLATGGSTFIGELTGNGRGRMDFYGGHLWVHNVVEGLSQIDLNTAAPTDVNPLASAVPFTFADAFCISPEGSMFYMGADLWILDSDTGAVSLGPEVSLGALWSGAVFLDNAPEPFTLWFGGLPNGQMEIHIAGASPLSILNLISGNGHGGSTIIPSGYPCNGTELNLNSRVTSLGTVAADINGRASLGPVFVPAAAIGRISVQAIDRTNCATSNAATVWN